MKSESCEPTGPRYNGPTSRSDEPTGDLHSPAGSETTRKGWFPVAHAKLIIPRPTPQLPDPPHIAELRSVVDALDASELLDELHAYRHRAYDDRAVGRRGYGPETFWRAYVAASHLNLGNTNDLYRRLEDDAALAAYCGFGAVLPHRTTFNRFIRRLAGHTDAIVSAFADMTEQLQELLPDLGEEVAIDATVVDAYGNPRSGADPDASWTAKGHSNIPNEKEWFYGYKLHLMVDSRHEVPLSMTVTTASRPDTLELPPLVEQAWDRFPWFNPYAASADKGYDSQANHEFLYQRGIIPVIPLRNTHTKESRGFFTRDGIPTCMGDKPMTLVSTDDEGRRLYRCPDGGCHLKVKRPGGVNYCDTAFWLDPGENLRLYGAIERTSPEWKEIYARRQSVERVFASLKQNVRLDRFNRMGLPAMTLHAIMSVAVYQARYLAQLQAGAVATRPWMIRRVA